MKILIAGASGFVGKELASVLRQKGHTVFVYNRKNPAEVFAHAPFDALVNLAGANIATKRWSKQYRQTIYQSRVKTTESLVSLLKTHSPNAHLVNASAMGFYGDQSGKTLDETTPKGEGFLSSVASAWEEAARMHPACTILRFGVVMHPSGGYLKALALPSKLHAGHIGSGNAWVSWIALEDLVSLIVHVLEQRIEGTYNACNPNPIQSKPLASLVASFYQSRAVFAMPSLIAKIVWGRKSELFLFSQKGTPAGIEKTSFRFMHPKLEAYLKMHQMKKGLKKQAKKS